MDEETAARMQADARNNILSEIEDYCILFGTNALPYLRAYIASATRDWTASPNPELVKEAKKK